MAEYDPNRNYKFTDKDGNVFYSKGDNGYVWQSMTEGIPISVGNNGEWYVDPYVSVNNGQVTAHIPEWFKSTPEYSQQWTNIASQIPNMSLTDASIKNVNDIIKSLGRQGALRYGLTQEATAFGITDPGVQQRYVENLVNGIGGSGQLNMFGGYDNSVDMAREVAAMSKEDLSDMMTNIYDSMEKFSAGEYDSSDISKQEAAADILAYSKILNYIDDNYATFGENEEFKGLLSASGWQGFNAMAARNAEGLMKGIFGIPARIFWGIANGDGDFDMSESWLGDDNVLTRYSGRSLEGTETAQNIGATTSAVENLIGTVALSFLGGQALAGKTANAAAGSFMSTVGELAGTLSGAAAVDFFFKDIPVDLLYFISDVTNEGVGKALWNPDEQSPLIMGLIGPQVPRGLITNLIGDAILDVTILGLGWSGTASGRATLDRVFGGKWSTMMDKAAVGNLKLQENVASRIPGLRKLVDGMMTPEDAAFMREARKASISSGSMDPYMSAQNVITAMNHNGSEVMSYRLSSISEYDDVQTAVKSFQKRAGEFGGIGKTEVRWSDATTTVGDSVKEFSKSIPDTLPIQVKQGLIDMDRLTTLKGQEALEGGLLSNPTRAREIARLEEAVGQLPEEITQFGELFTVLNKRLEEIGVLEGITPQQWFDQIQMDPRYSSIYFAEQVLMPDRMGRAYGDFFDPSTAKILQGARGDMMGNLPYIDPVQSFFMKADAMGRSIAWNERVKAMVAFQGSLGAIKAGKSNPEMAEQLKIIRDKIKIGASYRAEVKYDDVIGGVSSNLTSVRSAFNEINELLSLPDTINARSIYVAGLDPDIREVTVGLKNGKTVIPDDIIETAKLGSSEATRIVASTYDIESSEALGQITKTGRGVNEDGVPYIYTIEQGKVTSIKEARTPEEIARSVSKMAGLDKYAISADTIKDIGVQNALSVNRTLRFYKDNLPSIGELTIFKYDGASRPGTLGYIYGTPRNTGVDDGRVKADLDVFLGKYYQSGAEGDLSRTLREGAASGFHPKNSGDVSSVPIHENGHITVRKLGMERINEELELGKLNPEDVTGVLVSKYENAVLEEVMINALARMGVEATPNNYSQRIAQYRRQISTYADTNQYGTLAGKNNETVAEAMVDFAFNGDSAASLSKAIVGEMKERLMKYSPAAMPRQAWGDLGIPQPKGLFAAKSDDYAFPARSTAKKKAEWLDKEWRQKNPYIRKTGVATAEQYQRANTWDNFFMQEARRFDANYKVEMPSALENMNTRFQDNLADNAVKTIMDNIKKASVEGFDTNLANLILNKNQDDIADAFDGFIIRQIDGAAETLAKNMPGGLNPENLNQAKITLWTEDVVKNEVISTIENLSPTSSAKLITDKVEELFGTQARGLVAYEGLPVDIKRYKEQEKILEQQLMQGNRYARRAGKDTQFEQVIHYKEGGEDVYVLVSDPAIAKILKRPTRSFVEHGVVVDNMVKAAQTVNRMYRLGTTGISPAALVRNILRDPAQAMLTGGFNPFAANLDPQAFYRTLAQRGLDSDTIEAVTQRLRQWASSGTMTAEIRASTSHGVQNAQKIVEKALGSKVVTAAEAPLNMWEGMLRNQIAQQSFTKNYMKTNDVNKAMAAAMFDASNSTTNFSHAIGKFNNAVRTVPYLSSAINGTASFWRMFNSDPIGMTTRIMAGFVTPVLAITAWNLSSEERRAAYEKIPKWVRDTHLILIDVNGDVVMTPVPQEVSPFYTMSRMLMELTQGENEFGVAQMMAQGAFGFFPVDLDGFFSENGQVDFGRGFAQLASGLIPQAATAIYEFWAEKDMFTGQDLSNYSTLNKIINLGANIFGTSIKNIANDIGYMLGAPENELIGKSTIDTIARDIWGHGLDAAKTQFMNLVGRPATWNEQAGKVTPASGLFLEAESIQKKVADLDKQKAFAKDEDKDNIEVEKKKVVDEFGERVGNLMDQYQQMYSLTGGIEQWQRDRLVQLLMLGQQTSTGEEGSWESQASQDAYFAERGLAQQRYQQAGLPSGPTIESLVQRPSGTFENSIDLQVAINKMYGTPKQAKQDFLNLAKVGELKDIRNRFFDALDMVWDDAEKNGTSPDYNLIERIQAQYLQSFDKILLPVMEKYGIAILNDNGFINELRSYVNGMIPSDDWRQSTRNAKKFLSSKEFPTSTVDVEKWLKQRYASSMRDRGLDSDQWVKDQLESIRSDIDSGDHGRASGKIATLNTNIGNSRYYISPADLKLLVSFKNMVK